MVCLSIVLSIAFGFLSGFLTAGFALNENYSSIYESLISELEANRARPERDANTLFPDNNQAKAFEAKHAQINNQIYEQALFSVFGHAVEHFQRNDRSRGCEELNHLVNLKDHVDKWRHNAKDLLDKYCQ